jgi:hypothetical protein
MPLHPRVTAVAVVGRFTLRLAFRDGTAGTVDFADLLASSGGVFEALRDPVAFAAVTVDHEAGTIHWPNGADIDPDVLYEMVLRCAQEDSPSLRSG